MEAAQGHLKRAQELHALHRSEEALREARAALDLSPDFVEALTYMGTTLITRKLAYEEGLTALERAAQLAPGDAGVLYSLGWACEFVAYRLEKQAGAPYRDPYELYDLATRHLRRCIDLDPEEGLKADAQDLLDSMTRRFC
jgi:tetratricopeptide (TPR) repeat protein